MHKSSFKFISCLLVVLVGAVVLAPSAALAQDGSAPDQYIEHVPGVGGDKPSSDVNRGDPGSSSLPPSAAGALQDLGRDGQQAAALAAATGSSGKKRAAESDDKSAKGASIVGGATGDDGGSSGLSGVADNLVSPGSDGMGLVLPLLLLGVLIAGGAFAVRARMNKSEGDGSDATT